MKSGRSFNTYGNEYKGGNSMPVITKDTGIIEAVQKYPQIIQIFQAYGLGCVGCMAAHFETIGEGAGAHGLDVDALIADINDCIADSANQ
jgi:hybrid cluster-associated redox disulfide protein